MSKYPVVVEDRSAEVGTMEDVVFATAAAGGALPTAFVKMRGSGEDLDLTPVTQAVEAVETIRQEARWRDNLRERPKELDDFYTSAATAFHERLGSLDLRAIGDPDFWRWIGLARMWDLTLWRYHRAPGGTISRDWFGLDGAYWRSLPVSLYLRYELASRAAATSKGKHTLEYFLSGSQSVDLWQSHLFAVDTGFAAGLSAALLEERLEPTGTLHGAGNSGKIKVAGKNVTFLRRTLLVEALDMQDAKPVVEEALRIG